MDELDVIRSMQEAAGDLPRGYSMVGDDVSVVPSQPGSLVAKVDMLVEHTDVPPGMSYRLAARKAVAMCVSDFASKGVKPDSFMVSLGLKKGVSKGKVGLIAAGLADAQKEWGVHLVGGDTNEADELVIDCAMFGFAEKVVARKGASPGDLLFVTGKFGYTSSGLKIILSGAGAKGSFLARARKSVMEPTPNLGAGLALAPYLTSAMDSSDGLARSLHTLARESRVGFEVIELPTGDGVGGFAEENGFDGEKLVLEGGEEYFIVGTVKKEEAGRARAAARRAGSEFIVIGRATRAPGRVELRSGGKSRLVADRGWTHLGGG